MKRPEKETFPGFTARLSWQEDKTVVPGGRWVVITRTGDLVEYRAAKGLNVTDVGEALIFGMSTLAGRCGLWVPTDDTNLRFEWKDMP